MKASLLAALTTLHEKPLDYPAWGLTGALMREPTARERQYALEAVQEEAGAGEVDQVLFRAMLLQRCITEPGTGRSYSDGRPGPDGSPAIDPRTRTPIFTIEDIQDIADARMILFNQLWDDLLALAAAAPVSLFPSDTEDVSPERDEGAGLEGGEEGAGGNKGQRPSNADRGSEISGEFIEGTGDTP